MNPQEKAPTQSAQDVVSAVNLDQVQGSRSAIKKEVTATSKHVKLAREISKLLPSVIPAIAVLAAAPALSIPNDLSSVYGNGAVLQTPNGTALPEGVTLNGNQQTLDNYRFLGVEALDRSRLNISNWQTRPIPVTLPNGQTATAVFNGSTDYAIENPGDAVKRGFTLPEERITFSTDPEFLRNSGIAGIIHNHAFTADAHSRDLNPTEFGNAHIQGGMPTSANWMIVRDPSGNVIFEGKPATYAAQLYWNGTTAELSDAEGLQIGEGQYRTTSEPTTEMATESNTEQRSRQEVVETQHAQTEQKTWDTVETQQRTETTITVKPFQTQEVQQTRQNFDSNLNALFPLKTPAILHRDQENPAAFNLKTDFQVAGDIQSDSNPTLSGQVRVPLDTQRGTASLNLLVGGAPGNDQPGQPDFYALLFGQLNTPLFSVNNGQHQPSRVVAGARFGGGVFHVPVAAQIITQTVTQSGVDVIAERSLYNDFTTTTWGQNFTTHFTHQTTNDFVDTFRIDTTHQTPIFRDTRDVVVTRPDGSTFVATDYRQISERRGETVSTSTRSLIGSDLVASSSVITEQSTQLSPTEMLAQSTHSQLLGSDSTTERIVHDVTVTQFVDEKDAWGTLMFVNPYVGNFDLASVLKPGSLLYEAGGNFVQSSMLGNVSYKDSNLYLSLGMPVWNPRFENTRTHDSGLLTVRAYATYLPMTNDLKVGGGLQLSGF